MAEEIENRISVKDEPTRKLLESIAQFDAWRVGRGKVNMTNTLFRVLKEEWERIEETPEYKRYKKERTQT